MLCKYFSASTMFLSVSYSEYFLKYICKAISVINCLKCGFIYIFSASSGNYLCYYVLLNICLRVSTPII